MRICFLVLLSAIVFSAAAEVAPSPAIMGQDRGGGDARLVRQKILDARRAHLLVAAIRRAARGHRAPSTSCQKRRDLRVGAQLRKGSVVWQLRLVAFGVDHA